MAAKNFQGAYENMEAHYKACEDWDKEHGAEYSELHDYLSKAAAKMESGEKNPMDYVNDPEFRDKVTRYEELYKEEQKLGNDLNEASKLYDKAAADYQKEFNEANMSVNKMPEGSAKNAASSTLNNISGQANNVKAQGNQKKSEVNSVLKNTGLNRDEYMRLRRDYANKIKNHLEGCGKQGFSVMKAMSDPNGAGGLQVVENGALAAVGLTRAGYDFIRRLLLNLKKEEEIEKELNGKDTIGDDHDPSTGEKDEEIDNNPPRDSASAEYNEYNTIDEEYPGISGNNGQGINGPSNGKPSNNGKNTPLLDNKNSSNGPDIDVSDDIDL